MKRRPLLLLAVPFVLACTPNGTGGDLIDGGVDAGAESDAGDDADDAGGPADAGPEPEVEELVIGETVTGAISASTDQDAYRVPTTAGRFYRVHLTLPEGSLLAPHLTVIDSGRDDDNPGADYVQLSRTGAESDANLELVASGDGHIVVVRDDRNVSDGAGSGSAQHRYELRVEEHALADVSLGDLTFPSTIVGELTHAGAIALYRFEAEQWQNALFELSADADMDGRMWVIAESTGGWIARNDDQASSLNPRIDAPLTEGGVLWLVVDNVEPAATDLGYSLSVDVQ